MTKFVFVHPIELLACQGFSASTLRSWLRLYEHDPQYWRIPMYQAAGNTVPVPIILAAYSTIDPSFLIGPARLAQHLNDLEAFVAQFFPGSTS